MSIYKNDILNEGLFNNKETKEAKNAEEIIKNFIKLSSRISSDVLTAFQLIRNQDARPFYLIWKDLNEENWVKN